MKVFQLNDCDWWMAPTLEAAIEAAVQETGIPADELVEDPHELTAADMRRLWIMADDGARERTFAAELERRLREDPRVQLFASTEY